MPETGLSIWAAISDEALERRLRHYFWQAKMGTAPYAGRLDQLIAEAERRGKPEIAEKAQGWVTKSKIAPLL